MANELTSQQKQQAIDWVNAKARNLTCPSCGHKSFVISDHLVAASIFNPMGGLMIGGPSYPQFLVTCTNCGFVFHYSAVMAGLVSGPPPDASEDIQPAPEG